ncbi:MAG: crossover junction endodeoxyribonuclease RuvC [Acidimicrobiia bacterium]
MFVWGIDPGLSRCGYAVLDRQGRAPRVVAMGVLTTPPDDAVPQRLHAIQRDVRALLAEFPPVEVAIERVLFSVNVRTAIGVAQAAGVVMTEAVDAGALVHEYSPNEIKQAVAGDGAADKRQVEAMVRRLLRIERPIRPVDAADAAAVALCHVAHAPLRARVRTASQAPCLERRAR